MIQKNDDKRPILVDYTKKRAHVQKNDGKRVLGESSSGTWRNLKDVNANINGALGGSCSMFDSVSSFEGSTGGRELAAPSKDEFSLPRSLPRRTKSSNATSTSRGPRQTKEGNLRNTTGTMPSPIKFRVRRQTFQRSNSFDASKFSSYSHEDLQLETSTPEEDTFSSNAQKGDSKEMRIGRERSESPAPGNFRNPIRRTKSGSASGGREIVKTSSRLGSYRSLLRPTKSMSQEAMERCLATAQCQVDKAPTTGPHRHLQRSKSFDENVGPLRHLNRSGSARSLRRSKTLDPDNKTNNDETSSIGTGTSRRRRRPRRRNSEKDLDKLIESGTAMGSARPCLQHSGSTRSLNHSSSWRNLMHSSISSQLTAHTTFSDDCNGSHLFVTGSRIKRHDGTSRRNSSSGTSALYQQLAETSHDSAPRQPRRMSSDGRLEDSEHGSLHDRPPRLPSSGGRPPAPFANLLDSLDTSSCSYASSSDDESISSFCDSSMRSLGSSISTHNTEKPEASIIRPLTPPPKGSQSFAARVA